MRWRIGRENFFWVERRKSWMTGTKEHEALRSDALIMSVVKLGDSVRGGKEV